MAELCSEIPSQAGRAAMCHHPLLRGVSGKILLTFTLWKMFLTILILILGIECSLSARMHNSSVCLMLAFVGNQFEAECQHLDLFRARQHQFLVHCSAVCRSEYSHSKHLELQRAGFLCSHSWGAVPVLSFLCSSALCCCFVTLFPVRIEKSQHFGSSAQQPGVGQLFVIWGQFLCWVCAWQVPLILVLPCCRQQERKAKFPAAELFVSLPFSSARPWS